MTDRLPTPPRAASDKFDTLPLPEPLLATLAQLGYEAMTPIQAASLPLALAGRDVIAQARTGSGKTAAFALALLARLDAADFSTQAMVICPTRELAEQVLQEIRRLARIAGNIKVLSLCGGITMRPQLASLEHGAHVVVGTPGRLMDHLDRGSLVLDRLRTLVLDEADRMLDMGFHDDMVSIVSRAPASRQTLLFSATYPEGIARIAQRFMRQPAEVKVADKHAPGQIRERFYEVADSERLHAVSLLLEHYRPESTLAFCNTRQQCRDLVDVLSSQGYSALALHGELEQRERDQVLIQFANRSCSVLVATDVAARGLDIAGLAAVINVDITPDIEVHTHRIGRTGRAEQQGWALSLASVDEMGRVGNIEKALGRESEWHPLSELTPGAGEPLRAPMVTIQILGGRKDKVRPGDLLGALTKDFGFAGSQIGKINVGDVQTYVAVERGIADKVLARLDGGSVKGRKVKARFLGR